MGAAEGGYGSGEEKRGCGGMWETRRGGTRAVEVPESRLRLASETDVRL